MTEAQRRLEEGACCSHAMTPSDCRFMLAENRTIATQTRGASANSVACGCHVPQVLADDDALEPLISQPNSKHAQDAHERGHRDCVRDVCAISTALRHPFTVQANDSLGILACDAPLPKGSAKCSVPHLTTPSHTSARIRRGSPGSTRQVIVRERGFVGPANFCKRHLINLHYTSVPNNTLFCCKLARSH